MERSANATADAAKPGKGHSDLTTWTPGRAPVAVVMISLNEAHNMEAVLENLKGWAQEVFLVDSFSSDATLDIALRHGVHVVQHAFHGFGDQWNFALRELPISAPWTMKLDPDERISDRLKQEIVRRTATDEAQGFVCPIRLFFMEQALPVRLQLVRLWLTGHAEFSGVSANEHAIVSGQVAKLASDIEHHDSPDLHHWLAKQNKYTTAEAVARHKREPLSAVPRLFGNRLQRRMWAKENFFRVPFRYTILFLHNYLVLGAWRAGWVGLAWSRLRCDVYRLRDYKLREIRITGRLPRERPNAPGSPDPRVKQYSGSTASSASASRKSMSAGVRYHEQLAATWSDNHERGGFRRRLEFVDGILKDIVKPGSRWLDAGCGSGIVTSRLAAYGATGDAVDASPAMIHAALETGQGGTADRVFAFRKIETVERLDAIDDTYDGVLCLSVLEYLGTPSAALREFLRVLQPGGRLVISVANRRSAIRKAQSLLRSVGPRSAFEYLAVSRKTFEREEILQVLCKTGFKVESTHGFDPVLPAWTTKIIPPSLLFIVGTKPASGPLKAPEDL